MLVFVVVSVLSLVVAFFNVSVDFVVSFFDSVFPTVDFNLFSVVDVVFNSSFVEAFSLESSFVVSVDFKPSFFVSVVLPSSFVAASSLRRVSAVMPEEESAAANAVAGIVPKTKVHNINAVKICLSICLNIFPFMSFSSFSIIKYITVV